MRKRPLEERLWEKIQRGTNDECWLWTGVCSNGVPRISIGDKKVALVTRLAYTIERGPVLPGYRLVPTCDTQLCVNPYHRTALPVAEAYSVQGLDGFPCKRSRPTFEDVVEARRLYVETDISVDELNQRFRGEMGHWLHKDHYYHVPLPYRDALMTVIAKKRSESRQRKIMSTEAPVIRAAHALGMSEGRLAKAYEVDIGTISRIVHNKTYKETMVA